MKGTMQKLPIFTGILLFFAVWHAQAQTGNVWAFGQFDGIDFNVEPPQLIETGLESYGGTGTMCDSMGRLLFYSDGIEVFNRNHTIMQNGGGLWGGNAGTQTALTLPTDQSEEYVLFTNGTKDIRNPDSFYLGYSKVNMAQNNGLGAVTEKNKILFRSKRRYIGLTAVRHTNEQDIWVLTTTSRDTICALLYDGQSIVDTVFSQIVPRPTRGSGRLKPSHDGKAVVAVYDDFDSSVVVLYTFDPLQGKIVAEAVLLEEKRRNRLDSTTYVQYQFFDVAFSPNDSLFYITDRGSTSANGYNTTHPILQFQRYAPDIAQSAIPISKYGNNVTFGHAAIELAPNGKIYASFLNAPYLSIIESPNEVGKDCNYIYRPIQIQDDSIWGQYTAFPNNFFEYMRSEFTYTQNCDGQVRFINQSDTTKFVHFTWYLQLEHGRVDSLTGTHIAYEFPASGKYYVKLKAKTRAGYVQWHSDSVEYFKPPVAHFTTLDTPGCQYIAYQFTDTSQTDTLSPTTPESWHWDFGDGTTSTRQNPEHTYTESGHYTVTLIYHNGFCPDTLVKTQGVEILDAPKPGFAIRPQKGCAPLQVQVEDQTEGAITIYTYTATNGTTSHLPEPAFTFRQPGNWSIHQSLLGPTGCITQDSVTLWVSPGYTEQDRLHMVNATLTAQDSVQLAWESEPRAATYHLYRTPSGGHETFLGSFPDTIHTDQTELAAQGPVTYSVRAVDSCGHESGSGRSARTIHLTGQSEGNDFNHITWTPYEDWQGGVSSYEIQRQEPDGRFDRLATVGPREVEYAAAVELEEALLQSCYRIISYEEEGYRQQSTSNILCLPYQPLLWVPSAFSPNGDSINDYFQVVNFGIQSLEINIYNRWGEKVFHATDPHFVWSGRHQGKKVPAGSYVYQLLVRENNGSSRSLEGTLLVNP